MKYFFFLSFTLLSCFSGYAQQFKVNPQVGINNSYAKIDDDVLYDGGGEGGYQIGANLRLGDYDNWFYWQPGVFYKVAKLNVNTIPLDPNNPASGIHDVFQLNQLRIPLTGGFYLSGSDGIVRIRANAGIIPVFNLSVSDTRFPAEYSDFRAAALSANAGIGFDVLFITLDVNYELGLTKMYESGNGTVNALDITVGVVIPPTF